MRIELTWSLMVAVAERTTSMALAGSMLAEETWTPYTPWATTISAVVRSDSKKVSPKEASPDAVSKDRGRASSGYRCQIARPGSDEGLSARRLPRQHPLPMRWIAGRKSGRGQACAPGSRRGL